MEAQIIQLLLKTLKPEVALIKRYFGLNHPNLDLELLIVEKGLDPERTFPMTEFIPAEEIGRAFDEFFADAQQQEAIVRVLWLVGNLYYGDSVKAYEQYFCEETEDDLFWSTIEQELLQLYIFRQKHKAAGPVTIKVGKESLEIPNTNGWVQAILDNHVFPNCLPKTHSAADAEQLIWKKDAGAPVKHPEVNAIVNGVATMLFDFQVIKERAPMILCRFIRKYLVMMELISEGDPTLDEEWIKSQIHNFKKKSKDPRFPTREIKEVSPEDLKEAGYYSVKWAFSRE